MIKPSQSSFLDNKFQFLQYFLLSDFLILEFFLPRYAQYPSLKLVVSVRMSVVLVPEGRSREECIEIKKEREQELRLMMKRLEAKYAALQVVPVISKLGTQRVCVMTVS